MKNHTRILVVEDEPGILAFLKQGLEEEGYKVESAGHGLIGYEYAIHHDYDLILLDWMLPEMSGLEICSKIREKGILTPVIFLTAKDMVADTVQALRMGANDYIKKPFDFEELLARIEVQLRENDKEDRLLVLGNIKLNSETRETFLNNQPIHLTQKEFDLLEYLIQNKNKVCSRQKIIVDVWDIHFDYDTAILDVYMNAIRKKLNLTKDDEILQTIRGVGFMAKDI
ncbi:MAG: response regulator transcription factor [Weeksellaceae bacterium]